MLKKSILPALIAALVMTGARPVHPSETVKSFTKSFPVASLRALDAEVGVGAVELMAGEDTEIRIEVAVRCDTGDSRCRALAENVTLSGTVVGDEIRIEPAGLPESSSRGLSTDLKIHCPSALALKLHVGVGELKVSGLERDLDAETGVGEITVSGKAEKMGSASLECGVGDVHIDVPGADPEASGFLGRKVSWLAGKGTARIRAKAGVGEVSVRLQ